MGSQLATESSQQSRLDNNRVEQRELEEKLRKLKHEEDELVALLKRGNEDREGSNLALKIADEDVDEWRSKLVELHKRTHTALSVIGQMDGEPYRATNTKYTLYMLSLCRLH